MSGRSWHEHEDQELLRKINDNCNRVGGVCWLSMSLMKTRTLGAMKTRWSHFTSNQVRWDERKYVLKEGTCFIDKDKYYKVKTPSEKKNNTTSTPKAKRIKIKKSFLWGAIKFERYE